MSSPKSPDELYAEREKRVRDAIELREPDQVPVVLTTNYFPARYVGGLNAADSYYNYSAWKDATKKTVVDFAPDLHSAVAGGSRSALTLLGPKLFKWPGDGLAPNVMHQFLEGEPLKAEEYDEFLGDPGDFTLRRYLPRVWKAMEPLGKLPPLQSMWGGSNLAFVAARFSDPEVVCAFDALFKAGEAQNRYLSTVGGLDEELAELGFPTLQHGHAAAPFDIISDYLRGMTGAMLDMYRHPQQLLQACELILTRSIESGAVALRSKRGNPKRVGSALHRGSDGFMSLKQFDTFYWPTLKKLILNMVDRGLVHIPFYEGDWSQRLEHLLELPKGKTIARFALTDLTKAKAVLGGHTCIMGGVPHTLLQIASPSEVEDYCKNLIKICGKNGGFILTSSTAVTHEAKPENVKAMIAAAKKYGRY